MALPLSLKLWHFLNVRRVPSTVQMPVIERYRKLADGIIDLDLFSLEKGGR